MRRVHREKEDNRTFDGTFQQILKLRRVHRTVGNSKTDRSA